jgi:hypothetical protein
VNWIGLIDGLIVMASFLSVAGTCLWKKAEPEGKVRNPFLLESRLSKNLTAGTYSTVYLNLTCLLPGLFSVNFSLN